MTRAEELASYLEAVALGQREATDAEVAEAVHELDAVLPDLPTKALRNRAAPRRPSSASASTRA